MQTSDSLLRTNSLEIGYSYRRKSHTILSNINLIAKNGEFICLLGRNGSGKSTFLRTLAGMQKELKGTIYLTENSLQTFSNREKAKMIAVVLTERLQIGAMRGHDIVEFGRYPHTGWLGKLTPEDHEKVRHALEDVGATHLANREINQLSDGERQRLVIARALAQEPKLMLLDEPSAFLDAPGRIELANLLRNLAHKRKITVIAATHDLDISLRTSDTIWLITEKQRIESGSPEDLIANNSISKAFSDEKTEFDNLKRTFKLKQNNHQRAFIEGEGESFELAQSVLERTGWKVVFSPHESKIQISIKSDGTWKATVDDFEEIGKNFSELASTAQKLIVTRPDSAPTVNPIESPHDKPDEFQ